MSYITANVHLLKDHPSYFVLSIVCAHSGLSAWQNWMYYVKCLLSESIIREISHIHGTHAMVPGLQSSQHYVLSVWASSPGGRSHTVMFQGTTLQPGKDIKC